MNRRCTMVWGMLLTEMAFAQLPNGPFVNRDDQFRLFEDPGTMEHGFEAHACLKPMGVNTYNYSRGGFGACWDYAAGKPKASFAADVARRKRFYDRFYQDGISVIDQSMCASDGWLRSHFPRIRSDGSRNERNLDASDPRAREMSMKNIEAHGRSARHPAIVGFKTADEVRDSGHFSFTDRAKAAWRAYSGKDLPSEVLAMTGDNRNPSGWEKNPAFPKDRVVPDDYPLLDFYRWCWKTGDGWNDYLTESLAAYRRGFGAEVFGVYTPSLRTPPFWGNGGKMQMLSHWTYPYPEPYNVAFNTAEQQAAARGEDKMIIPSIQGISYRSKIAPSEIHPANEPAWSSKYPNCKYPTTPRDMLREALWAAFMRRVDGVGSYGFEALFDEARLYAVPAHYNFETNVYRCAQPSAAAAIGEVFNAVAPLGPLLRAVPERQPVVAVLESYASMILAGRVTWDCQGAFFDAGVLATAANLLPYAINEEEVATRGIPSSVKVLIAVDCDVLTRSAYDEVMKFVRRGGLILGDDRLLPALKADGRFPLVPPPFAVTESDHDEGGVATIEEGECRDRKVKAAAAQLKAWVKERVGLYADTDNRDVIVHVRSFGDADYVFPLNDRRTYGDYVGPWKRVMEQGLPNAAKVELNRAAGAVYDLVRHQAVPFTCTNGKTVIPVEFATTEGKVLMVTSRPLAPLRLSVRGTTVRVSSADREAMIPIEVRGAGARPFTGVVRDGQWIHDFGEAPKGEVSVLNLADGVTYR